MIRAFQVSYRLLIGIALLLFLKSFAKIDFTGVLVVNKLEHFAMMDEVKVQVLVRSS